MSDWFEFQGLDLAYTVLSVGSMVAALAAGVKSGERWGRVWGWLIGLGTFVLLFALLSPAMDLLQARQCQMDPLMEDCD